jgi:hypothetical protein
MEGDMRNWTFLLLAIASTGAAAQEVMDQTGLEMGLTYRKGDPFLFCTEGQGWKNAPAQCWIPLPPYTGAYTMMPWCDLPNPYGKSWTQDDTRSLAQYLTICPVAMESGEWDGQNGQPDMTPMDH